MKCEHKFTNKTIRYCKSCEREKTPHFHEYCNICVAEVIEHLDPDFMQEAMLNS